MTEDWWLGVFTGGLIATFVWGAFALILTAASHHLRHRPVAVSTWTGDLGGLDDEDPPA